MMSKSFEEIIRLVGKVEYAINRNDISPIGYAKAYDEMEKAIKELCDENESHKSRANSLGDILEITKKSLEDNTEIIKQLCDENKGLLRKNTILSLEVENLKSEIKQIKFIANSWSDKCDSLKSQVEVLKQNLNDAKL